MQQNLIPHHSEDADKRPKVPKQTPREAIYHARRRQHVNENPLATELPTVLSQDQLKPEEVTHEEPTRLRNPFNEETHIGAYPGIEQISSDNLVTYVTQLTQDQAIQAIQPSGDGPNVDPIIEVWIDPSPDIQDVTIPDSVQANKMNSAPQITEEEVSRIINALQTPTVNNPEITFGEEVEVDLDDIYEEQDLKLENFLTKEKLEGADAYLLFDFLKSNPANLKLWEFIEKIAPKPIDFVLFKENLRLLSPLFIHSLLVNGSFEETYIDEVDHQEKSVYLVSLSKLAQGGIGLITNALYCEEGNLQLEPMLVKTALENQDAQDVFPDELHIAKRVKVAIDRNPQDERTKRLLRPAFVGRNFLVMPIVKDKTGQSIPLNKLPPTHPDATPLWAKQMVGAVKANSFLTEQGIINADFKASNILMTENGGVVIDPGSLLEKNQLKSGKAEIWADPKTATVYPFLNNATASRHTIEEWEANNGNVPRTPSHLSLHLLALEMQDQIPSGTVHKYTLGRIIERYFANRFGFLRSLPDQNTMNELDKLYQDPIHLDPANLNGADQLLYNLYLKLQKAHFHPYHFKDDNVKKGLDPEYISNSEIIAALEDIANTKN